MTILVVQICIGSRTKVSKVFWVRSVGSVGFGVAWVGRVPGRLRADVVLVHLFGCFRGFGVFEGALLLALFYGAPPHRKLCAGNYNVRAVCALASSRGK